MTIKPTEFARRDSLIVSITFLACLVTVVIGCYLFLHLTAKQLELGEKQRRIRRLEEARRAEQKNRREAAAPGATGQGLN